MSANQIVKSVNVATITKGGKQVVLAVATQTQKWNRTEAVARSQEPGFKKSVLESPTALPAGTTKVVSRDNKHSSAADPRDHYSGCCYDANGNFIQTEHFVAE
ncbi:hypothetical protein MMC24_005051 [Lignoscripta atroalba]|nr:hypothetical protein [Lignoscripta atroalba]